MKGIGTNEKKLIKIIGKFPPLQMNQIIKGYKSNYGKELLDDVKNETSGDFGKLCCALSMPIIDYDVKCLHEAVDRCGTDDDCLMEILVGRTNNDIKALCSHYKAQYCNSLEDDIKGDTSGYVRRLYTVLLQGNRDETNNARDVNADAEELYRAGEGRMGTDEMAFISMLCNRPDSHLRQVFDVYQQKHGHTIEKAIKKEFSGNIENALLNLVASIRNKAEYIATLFEKSMKGLGTDDEKLIRLTVRHRAPYVIEPIKQAYKTKYGKTLAKRIKGDTSGDYRKLLIACINGENDL
ncbi:annexin A4 [Piromyces finnis]|uniref:Annexin n=1 Tax=Piromyces finnis TaxID=1754191 RepID=A0A1Y1UXE0_9FUNG|nr:annexin A4 [Piromyces finnis]|eukprot:ORX42315.1 annexin A4 [Piromyces finnis]